MKKRGNIKKTIFFSILALLILLFIIRLINPTEIDDVTPGIHCPEIEKYNPKILYVVPNYNNTPISQDKEWCQYIFSLNKTLYLHGINHTYREFLYKDISQEDLDFGISEFESCFNLSLTAFKPPQLKINKENRRLIRKNNIKLKGLFNQLTHKVYHCEDSSIIPNKIIKIF